MSDMPEGAESVMYLRDGWPDVVVCKVKMQTGHVGVGVYRSRGVKFSPENMDHLAMRDALANASNQLQKAIEHLHPDDARGE